MIMPPEKFTWIDALQFFTPLLVSLVLIGLAKLVGWI
jgi:hypothetical protein